MSASVAYSIFIPRLCPRTTLNTREHWATKANRVRKERAQARMFLSRAKPPTAFPITITLSRFCVRELDDDNAVGAMKGVRDEVAAWLGVDDRDKRVKFIVDQVKCKRADVGVLVEWTVNVWRREDERTGRAG
jgi:hypothetical protein